jgi:phosphatidylglycerophosphatase A
MISAPEQIQAKVLAMPKPRVKAPLWAMLIATWFYVGRLKPGPGTWASVVAMLMWVGLGGMLAPAWLVPALVAAVVVVTALGIAAGTRVASDTGDKDPCYVVVDEVAGQWIALIGAPLGWKSMLAGLILFRFFDILKPPPLRRFERFPGGVGIMMDDIGAGLYALAVMQLLFHFRLFA